MFTVELLFEIYIYIMLNLLDVLDSGMLNISVGRSEKLEIKVLPYFL